MVIEQAMDTKYLSVSMIIKWGDVPILPAERDDVRDFRHFNRARNLRYRGDLGRSGRRKKCEALFCQAALARLFTPALGLVHHWSALLCDLLFYSLPPTPTQR